MASAAFKSSPFTPQISVTPSAGISTPDGSFSQKPEQVVNLAKLGRTFSPLSPNGRPNTPMISPITMEAKKSPVRDYVTPLTAKPRVFRKNKPKPMDAAKAKKVRRLTMFKVPLTPSPRDNDATKAKMNFLNSSDLNRPLGLNLILKEIGMMKYSDLFMSEEFNIAAFLTLNEADMKAIGITDQRDLKILLNAVKEFQFLK